MAIKIYVDILFLTNLIFDYVLLLFTALFTKNLAKPHRILIASGVGGLISVYLFFYVKNAGLVMLFGLLTSSIMIILAFGVKDFFCGVRMSCVLYVTTFTLGGAVMSLIKSERLINSGGAFYIDIGMTELILCGVITYIISKISYGYILNRKRISEKIYDVTFGGEDKEIKLKGFFDTGNIVKDINGRGVIIADFRLKDRILHNDLDNLEDITVKTLGGEAVLQMTEPKTIFISDNGNIVEKKRKIAFSKKKIYDGFSMILPEDIFD